jgi:MFS transporter, DHA3 family, macrolide efflux protein
MKIKPISQGWKTFYVIWSGQAVSTLGTAMSRFALMIWAYQLTQTATSLALLGFFNYGTLIICSPLAGVLVDRLERKHLLLLTDFCCAIMSAIILGLNLTGSLQIWHLYLLEALTGAFESVQYPAYQASVSLLLPSEDFTRATSLNGLSDSLSRILAPVLAAVLLPVAGIKLILMLDLVTFGVAFVSLLISRIPQPAAETQSHESHWLSDIKAGYFFMRNRPGLMGLVTIYAFINLFAGLTYFSIISAMILARSNQNAITLSWVESALGMGGVIGGIVLSIWGGPKHRVRGLLLATGISFLFGDGTFAFGRILPVWMVAGFVSTFFIPFITSPNQSIWQSKTPPEIQGRVFALRGMLQMATIPLGYLAAGPLADHLFEPAMRNGGTLATYFGWITGVGPGAGMALMFACTAIGGFLTAVIGYSVNGVRNVENDLPDAL